MPDPIYRPGHVVWRELMTPDTAASIRFYGEVLGWKTDSMPMPDGNTYTMIKAGEKPIGGIMKLPAPGIPPHWAIYVSVDDVDAAVARANEAGGKVLVGPMDAGGIGRFAAIADPQGGTISAWKSNTGDRPRADDERPGVGEFCWEQLNSSDPAAASPFYAKVFGWSEGPFPGGGDMKVWSAGKVQVASCMQTPPGVPSHWLTYVVVDTLAAANGRVEKHGGKVLMPRIEVPTIGSISVVQDGFGATLGLFEAPSA